MCAGTVQLDRFMRVLGLYRLAEANFEHFSAPVRATIEAYTAGVNAQLEARSGPLPPEPPRPYDWPIDWPRSMKSAWLRAVSN